MNRVLRQREAQMRACENASGLAARRPDLIEHDNRRAKAIEGFGVTRCPLNYCIARQCAAFSRRQKRCLEGF